MLLSIDRKPYVEARKRCASCSKARLADPCPARACIGEASGKRGLRFCRGCRQEKKIEDRRAWQEKNREGVRESNRRSYQLHAKKRLEQRRQRRERDGEDVRARDRASYAKRQEARRGRPVIPRPRKNRSDAAALEVVAARRGEPIAPAP